MPDNRNDDVRNQVSRAQAEDAVRTLLRWSGDDPAREGLLDTPRRVVEAYGDWFSGYAEDPRAYLERTFEVLLKKAEAERGSMSSRFDSPFAEITDEDIDSLFSE